MLDDLKIVNIKERDDGIQLVFECKGLFSTGIYTKDISISDIISGIKEIIEFTNEQSAN